MSNSEMGLQFEIDDLSAENLKLKDTLQTKRELAEKEIQTNEIDFNTEMSQAIEKVNWTFLHSWLYLITSLLR